MGVVAVPDERLAVLTRLNSSVATVPTTVEFVDIAGLVKGASKGEGLGNKCAAQVSVRSAHHVHGEPGGFALSIGRAR